MRLLLCCWLVAGCSAQELRLGIIGTDTSHVPAFTRVLNDKTAPDHVPGARVVAAFKGGSPDMPASADRVEKFAAEIQSKYGVELVPDIPTLLSKVDAVLLHSVDGRVHLAQARQVIRAGKPMFIDKPLATTLADAREIARLAGAAGVPWFSSSVRRFQKTALTMKFADTTGAVVWGPGPIDPTTQLDLAWYAIHPIELLFTLMGTGCEEVTRTSTEGADILVGRWKDGRIGIVRATRPSTESGAVVFRPKSAVHSDPSPPTGYQDLVREVVTFFQTRKPPVSAEETLEIFAFMDAALKSKETGGKPVRLR